MAKLKEQDSGTIEQILECTIECIAEQGYEGASMRTIATRSGVAKSLLHYHFSTKEDLMLRAARYMADSIAADITRRADADADQSLERLAGMAADLYELFLGDRKRCAFMTEMYATAGHVERVAELLRDYRQVEYNLIEERVRDALGDVLDQGGVGLAGFCTVVQTVMRGMISQHNVLENDAVRREQWQSLVQTILNSMVLPALQMG